MQIKVNLTPPHFEGLWTPSSDQMFGDLMYFVSSTEGVNAEMVDQLLTMITEGQVPLEVALERILLSEQVERIKKRLSLVCQHIPSLSSYT